jgi:geranylgeranyl transferase type-2 subunit beta
MQAGLVLLGCWLLWCPSSAASAKKKTNTAEDILAGLREFYRQTARADGAFGPGIDPNYGGMSDSAASDLAAVTYAVVVHRTFGWKLPFEENTRKLLLGRQHSQGFFRKIRGHFPAKSALALLYNTTQGVVALHALGVKPRYDPLPVLDKLMERAYKKLPPYTTSFFPLAYLACGKPFPPEADRKLQALMVQAEDGYLNNHIAATFHRVHYDRLLKQKTPKTEALLKRILREQKDDGSWVLNPLARDRHATFDAVFVLHQLGKDRKDCRQAVQRAAAWALQCRNPDGGFGHYPGSPSDADSVYFQVGTLVMAGFLKPAQPLPPEPELYSWGHIMPVGKK